MAKKLILVLTLCANLLAVNVDATVVMIPGSGESWQLAGTQNYSSDPTNDIFIMDLPGDAAIRVFRETFGFTNLFRLYRATDTRVEFRGDWLGSLRFFSTLSVGETWDDLAAGQGDATWGSIAGNYRSDTSPAYGSIGEPIYIPFYFPDTSDGDSTKYGYVSFDIVSNGGLGSANVLTLSINHWAYESTPDTQIVMGAVPESSTFSALAGLCALIFVGLRRRRR